MKAHHLLARQAHTPWWKTLFKTPHVLSFRLKTILDPEAGMNVSNAVLSHVIGKIYDCVVDPGLWDDALDEIRAAIGSHNAALSLHDRRTAKNS